MLADINGTKIHYRVEGRDGAPWLAFSNSLATPLALWQLQVDYFADHYRILRYDIRGHGGSPAAPGPYSPALLAGDIIGLLDHLDIAQTHLVGISIGAMTALEAACTFPGRFLSVTAANLSVAASPENVAGWEERIAIAEAGGIDALIEPFLTRWFTADYRAANPQLIAAVTAMIRETTVTGFVGGGRALQQAAYGAKLAAITCPALFIGAAQDSAAPADKMRAVARDVPDSAFVLIDPAGHLSNLQNPAAFNAALEAFLKAA